MMKHLRHRDGLPFAVTVTTLAVLAVIALLMPEKEEPVEDGVWTVAELDRAIQADLASCAEGDREMREEPVDSSYSLTPAQVDLGTEWCYRLIAPGISRDLHEKKISVVREDGTYVPSQSFEMFIAVRAGL